VEDFLIELVKFAPAVAILLYLNARQERRIERLTQALIDCFRDCEDRIDPDDGPRREETS
jgi:hypothetical protein